MFFTWMFASSLIRQTCLQCTLRRTTLLRQCIPSSYAHCKRKISQDTSSQLITTVSEFPAVKLMENAFTIVHDTIGLPWWATILGTALSVRLLLLPVQILIMRVHARSMVTELQYMRAILSDVKAYQQVHRLSNEVAEELFLKRIRKTKADMYREQNAHPARVIILSTMFIAMPWATVAFGLRNLCGGYLGAAPESVIVRQDMGGEGFLWFTNLLETDFFLPSIMLVGILYNFKFAKMKLPPREMMPLKQFMHMRVRLFLWTCVGSVLFPVALCMPVAMPLLWTFSIWTGLLERLLLSCPKVKAALKIRRTPGDSATPFRDLLVPFRQPHFLSEQIRDQNLLVPNDLLSRKTDSKKDSKNLKNKSHSRERLRENVPDRKPEQLNSEDKKKKWKERNSPLRKEES